TFVGGIDGVIFLYDRYKSRERSKSLSETKAKRSPSPNELFFQEVMARHKAKPDLKTIFTDWELRWTAMLYLASSICFGLVSFWFGFGGQALFTFFGGIPLLLISHFLGKTGRHEKAESVF